MPTLDQIIQRFQGIDRNLRLEMLLDFAQRLPVLPERFNDAKEHGLNRVTECQTPVFLWTEVNDGAVQIYADVPREAPTVRGFVALLIKGLGGASPAQVAAAPNDLLERLQLSETLGMTRMQGLSAIVQRIKRQVAEGETRQD